MNKIERKLIVNEISLKSFLNYTSSVHEIEKEFKGVKRENKKAKVKASLVSKIIFSSMLCGQKSINECVLTNKNKSTKFTYLLSGKVYTEIFPKQ